MKIYRLTGFVLALFILGLSCSGSKSNRYKTAKIGNQEWMAENLNTSLYRNGDKIPEAKTAEEWVAYGAQGTGAWCYYDNDPAKGEEYGKLYNWYAVNDPRGLAPQGWHIPTNAEWVTLTATLGGKAVAGSKMKSMSGWENDGNGTNESGFSALPGGYRNLDGYFYDLGNFAYFWSSTEYDYNRAWYRSLNYDYSTVYRDGSFKDYGFSVRCARD